MNVYLLLYFIRWNLKVQNKLAVQTSIVSVALKQFLTQQDEDIVHDAWNSIYKIL